MLRRELTLEVPPGEALCEDQDSIDRGRAPPQTAFCPCIPKRRAQSIIHHSLGGYIVRDHHFDGCELVLPSGIGIGWDIGHVEFEICLLVSNSS